MVGVFALRCRYPQSTHYFFDTDIAVAPRQVCDVYDNLPIRLRLRMALADVRVIKYKPKVRLEDVDAVEVLCVRGAVSRLNDGGRSNTPAVAVAVARRTLGKKTSFAGPYLSCSACAIARPSAEDRIPFHGCTNKHSVPELATGVCRVVAGLSDAGLSPDCSE